MDVILSYEKLFEIAWNAICELENSEYEHGAILDYLNITEEEYRVIKATVEVEKEEDCTDEYDTNSQKSEFYF